MAQATQETNAGASARRILLATALMASLMGCSWGMKTLSPGWTPSQGPQCTKSRSALPGECRFRVTPCIKAPIPWDESRSILLVAGCERFRSCVLDALEELSLEKLPRR